MENNKNKKSVKFQGDTLNFCDFIHVFVFTPNHHLKVMVVIVECQIAKLTKSRIILIQSCSKSIFDVLSAPSFVIFVTPSSGYL